METAQWYVFDYGMVISEAPGEEDWQALREACGLDVQDAQSPYWAHRTEFDAGRLSSEEYWSRVLGREAGLGLAGSLDALDANAWSHYNLDTLDVVEGLSARGEQLALLSNMPSAMADEFSGAAWSRYFRHLFFSSRLGLIKPDPRVFDHVLAALGVPAEQVTFVDDKQENVDAAAALGMRAILHTPGIDLQREIGL